MANITASTALRDFITNRLTTSGGCYMFATLHTSAAAITAATVYAGSGLNEVAEGHGYNFGGKTCGTITGSAGVLDTPDVVWTSTDAVGISAQYCCLWINGSNTITGASLVCMKDAGTVQTATNGGTMTGGIAGPISIPTPA